MRPLSELLSHTDSAWPLVQEWMQDATSTVEVLPAADSGTVLHELQVTTRSTLGAIVYETGGLLIDHSWVRVLGAGNPRLPPAITEWNRGRTRGEGAPLPNCLLVADDVMGGLFALDGGAFGEGRGAAYYFAPDTLDWEHVADGYTSLLQFLITGNLAEFYGNFRWPGWETEVEPLAGNRALHVYPPPWAEEGRNLARCSRRDVPVEELFRLNVIELPRQLERG